MLYGAAEWVHSEEGPEQDLLSFPGGNLRSIADVSPHFLNVVFTKPLNKYISCEEE